MYKTDQNDSDSIDRGASIMHWTRSTEAEAWQAYNAVKSNIDWILLSEPHAMIGGGWTFSGKPDPNFDPNGPAAQEVSA